jgi:ATP-dependent Clp protease ATP-binding subunit ClpB
LRKELDAIKASRETLMNTAGDEAYAQLAALKSREMRIDEKLNDYRDANTPELCVENLAAVIEQWTKIPASRIREQEFSRLAGLEERLKTRLIGQDEAVEAVAAAIRRGRAGVSAKRKPISFIFTGPTGVGKTELVKCLAADLFDAPESLIRLDMSEYMEKHAVSRIIGAPPGYVGYDEAGQLTEKVRRKPYCVILFDEIEKAHPDVLNILLQILDDGHITDAHGRKVNFENAVIIMTSNAGSDKNSSPIGYAGGVAQQSRDKAMKALQDFLRPEFINRVDEVVAFNPLALDHFSDIAVLMLKELADNLFAHSLHFTWDDAVPAALSEKSYTAKYGARNLRRAIQKDIEDALASLVISAREDPYTHMKAVVKDGDVAVIGL